MIAVVEAGGTSFRLAVCVQVDGSSGEEDLPRIVNRTEIDSSHDQPAQTLEECCLFFLSHKPAAGYSALALASFGPIGVNVRDRQYGCILETTPKKSWRGVNLLKPLQDACQGSSISLKVRVETDVNAPAWAEFVQHNSAAAIKKEQPITSLAYVTVGTGVGVGVVCNGKTVHGRMHPEGGHIPIQALADDTFRGYSWGPDHCPFKGKHTVEGIASSVALTERLEQQLKANKDYHNNKGQEEKLSRAVLADLPNDHELWDHAANAIACLCVTLQLTISIEKIVLGGGVLQRAGLLHKIRARTVELLNGYLPDCSMDEMKEIITTSKFGNDAGLVGALVLGQQALLEEDETKSNGGDEEKINFERKLKQESFGVGMIQGMLVGAVGASLAIKYFFRRR